MCEFFEDVGDFIVDFIVDGLGDFFSFEWLGDIGDFFSDLGEISGLGFAFGALAVGIILVPFPILKHSMLSPFLENYGGFKKMMWGGITILGTFIAGYVIGKLFEDS